MDLKVTKLLRIKYNEEAKGYQVALWGMAITEVQETQAECMEMIEKIDIDMMLTAMYGIASQLIIENEEKRREVIEQLKAKK